MLPSGGSDYLDVYINSMKKLMKVVPYLQNSEMVRVQVENSRHPLELQHFLKKKNTQTIFATLPFSRFKIAKDTAYRHLYVL